MGKSRQPSTSFKKGRANGRARSLRDGLLPMTQSVDELMREKPVKVEPFRALTEAQADYHHAIMTQDLVFGIGPAGTGKTYVVATAAADCFLAGDVKRIVITRPAQEAGEKLGFMPGDMHEKVGNYMTPLMEVLNRRLGKSHVEALIRIGKIEILPLAFMRGRSLAGCFCILDEAQNATKAQMKMFLTRIGEGSRMVVDGDPTQDDLPSGVASGLMDAVDRLEHLPSVTCVRFTRADIVRHGLVQQVVEAYERRS